MSDENEKVELNVEGAVREEKLSELDILRQSLEEAQAKEKKIFDEFLRLRAEFDNFRKRSEARLIDSRNFGKEEILLELVGLTDTFEQALQSSERATDLKSIQAGLIMVHRQFEKFLKDQGLVPIEALGQKLDPHKHEVIAQEESEEADEGSILAELQKGYTFNDRVVRTTKVRVATKPKSVL